MDTQANHRTGTRTIDVRRQRNLTLTKTFGLCLKGIRHRLMRSTLTLAVIVLAVAFFMFLLSENMIVQSVGHGIRKRIDQRRLAAHMLNRLYTAPPPLLLAQRLAAARDDGPGALAEYAAVTGWAPDRVAALAKRAATEQRYLRFFDELPPGKRIILVGQRRHREGLRALVPPADREAFHRALTPMPDVELPEGADAWNRFLDAYPQYESESTAFASAWQARQASFASASQRLTGDTPIEAWLAGATDEQLEAWRARVVDSGFLLSPADAGVIREQLAAAERRHAVTEALSTPDRRDAWRRTFRERQRTSTDAKLLRLGDARAAGLLDGLYTPEQLRRLADDERENRRLQNLEQALAGALDPQRRDDGLTIRQRVLLVISLLVCMVGIANAMLMSITERFREIATMKCLGATDSFILRQFMMEAALQGLTGGVVGMGIGFAIAVAKNALILGGAIFDHWPGGALGASAVVALATGGTLAVLASIYPSWAASRMAPMEAMRVEYTNGVRRTTLRGRQRDRRERSRHPP